MADTDLAARSAPRVGRPPPPQRVRVRVNPNPKQVIASHGQAGVWARSHCSTGRWPKCAAWWQHIKCSAHPWACALRRASRRPLVAATRHAASHDVSRTAVRTHAQSGCVGVAATASVRQVHMRRPNVVGELMNASTAFSASLLNARKAISLLATRGL